MNRHDLKIAWLAIFNWKRLNKMSEQFLNTVNGLVGNMSIQSRPILKKKRTTTQQTKLNTNHNY